MCNSGVTKNLLIFGSTKSNCTYGIEINRFESSNCIQKVSCTRPQALNPLPFVYRSSFTTETQYINRMSSGTITGGTLCHNFEIDAREGAVHSVIYYFSYFADIWTRESTVSVAILHRTHFLLLLFVLQLEQSFVTLIRISFPFRSKVEWSPVSVWHLARIRPLHEPCHRRGRGNDKNRRSAHHWNGGKCPHKNSVSRSPWHQKPVS